MAPRPEAVEAVEALPFQGIAKDVREALTVLRKACQDVCPGHDQPVTVSFCQDEDSEWYRVEDTNIRMDWGDPFALFHRYKKNKEDQ